MTKRIRLKRLTVLALVLSIIACSSGTIPVVERTRKQMPSSGLHKVRQGETLYSIAWSYGLDYKNLARANGVRSPYVIRAGQTLYLRGPAVRPASRPVAKRPKPPVRSVAAMRWAWPTSGKILSRFGSRSAKKGINIQGRLGQTVRAAQSGVVVYAGNGIRGYGNLLIVKHNAQYLSAYAYNSRIFAKEGQKVKVGQKIAEIGKSGNAQSAMLHFEIRRGGQPVDPLHLLPKH